jgi:hypothetical protein
MPRPLTASKLLLIADRRVASPDPSSPAVRRYRLARLRFDGRPTGGTARFDHLKRSYE